MKTLKADIDSLIDGSDKSQMAKNVMKGFIARAEEREQKQDEDRALIEKVANEKKLSEIIISTDEVKIYTVYGKDDWDVKYPYRSIYKDKDGKWERCNTVSPTLDTAYLVYLEKKHIGINSQFADFAMKMLEIKLEE